MDRDRGSLLPGGDDPRGDVGGVPAPTIGVRAVRARRRRGLLVVLAAAVLLPATWLARSGDAPAAAATPRSAVSSYPLTLLAQTPWVVPGQAFDVHLLAGAGSGPSSQLGISVAVYPCLSSVSAFDQSLAAPGPSGTPVSQTTSAVPVASLRPLPGGGFDLPMAVTVGTARSAAPSTGAPFTIQLTDTAGQCQSYPAGVYPVRLTLTEGSSSIGALTTHLVYTNAPATTQRLRVALVLPLQTAQGPARQPSAAALAARPAAALAPPSPSAVSGVSGVIGALAAAPAVPATLELSGQTLGVLGDGAHASTLAQLADLATAPGVHQFLTTPFTPVDAGSLVANGLGSELAAQVTRGTQVLTAGVPHAPGVTVPSPAGPGAGNGAWVTGDDLDDTTVAALVADGYTQLVLPPGSVASAPANGSTTESFVVGSGRGSMTAVTSDADLAARFVSAPGDPVLAANQLAAELAQLYYEKPNATTPRGVVVVAPNAWNHDPTFLSTLLGALDGNPIVEPVTLSGLFATFPTASSCRGESCRLTGTGATGGLPAAAIRDERHRQASFATAAVGARSLLQQLGDLVLAGESELLHPSEQSTVLDNAGAALDAQLGQLVVAGDRSVTLTSQQGTVNVTIVSNASYPVTATLTLTSDKLLFPNGTTQWSQPNTLLLPAPHTNIVPVRVTTRASGSFKVAITLHSPGGALLLSSGSVAVHSTATSWVGIALTVGAVVVLAAWWIRTSRKRRAARAAEDLPPDEPADEMQPTAVR